MQYTIYQNTPKRFYLPILHGSPTRRSQKHPMILMVTTLHCPTKQMYSAGMHEVERKELYYMGTDFLVRKLDLLKVEKPRRDGKIRDNE